jgi:hypothetical protein
MLIHLRPFRNKASRAKEARWCVFVSGRAKKDVLGIAGPGGPIGPVEAVADLASPAWRNDREKRRLQTLSPSAEEDASLRGARLRGFQRNALIDLDPGTKGLFGDDIDPDRSF